MPDFDVVILGGGLAGLSVAVRLAAGAGSGAEPGLRVLVLEARPAYARDRTWCSWRLVDHPFADAIRHSWTSWEVSRERPGRAPLRIRAGTPEIPYDMIEAGRLYEVAAARLAASPGVELRLGAAALGTEEHPDHVVVATKDGPITAAYVLDGRPPKLRTGAVAQVFLGQEIRTEEPVFDPGCVTLMDFAVPQRPDAVRFLYVLPVSAREALVEDTWFAPPDLALPDHREGIRAYLAARFGVSRYEVGFEERGAIPMDAELSAPGEVGRIVPIGTRGGAIKPSSGYGFLPIQRMADALAGDLLAGRAPRSFQPRDPASRWMDAVFLRALASRPDEAGRIFTSLFSKCPPGPLLRFLNDVGTPADKGRVIAATPVMPMLRAAFHLE